MNRVDTSLKNILVVESNKIDQIYYRYVLSAHYLCPVYTVDNNKDALSIIKTNHLDLIFLDVSNPMLNGVELLENIRKKHINQDYPIIAILEDYDEKLIERIKSLGVTEYLVKPLNSGSIFKNLGIFFN